jgi:hypothetical protein
VNTRHNTDFDFPTVRLTALKYVMGMKIFNHLATDIKILSNRIKQFKPALKKYLLRQSFYSLEEYFIVHNTALIVIKLLLVSVSMYQVVILLYGLLLFNRLCSIVYSD